MARAEQVKTYQTFVKGMITEASPLTYPADASIDEDNCIIFRKGNRSRRFGIDFETDYQLSSFDVAESSALREYRWESVDNEASLNFLCIQVGLTIYLYKVQDGALSANQTSFSIDLTSYIVPGTLSPETYEVSMASGRGYLFIVGEKLEPLIVEYDKDSDSITVERIYIQIRDFIGVDDSLANDEEPPTLTDLHKYNLENQGWVAPANRGDGATVAYFDFFGKKHTYRKASNDPITTYYNKTGRYPGNNKQWWVAKASSDGDGLKAGDFSAKLLEKFYFGNNRAPRGHYIVDPFRIDRSEVSGIPGIPVEIINDRPSSVAFFSGRVWYACNSTVYYSQILDSKAKAGFCYQEADPTAESISDLIASDGGVLQIPEMAKAIRLYSTGPGVLVFSTNGLWYVSGTSAGFSALDVSVSKVSPIGTESPNSVVEGGEGKIFWWSKIGIMAVSQKSGMFGPVEGAFDKENITEQTIQGFYNDEISDSSKRYVKGIYDPATNVIQWLFKTSNVVSNYAYDRVLNLDLTLQAFYPWTISQTASHPYVCGLFITPYINRIPLTINVVSDGDQVINGADNVILADFSSEIRNTFIKYVCIVPGTPNKLTFALFSNTNFADWETFDSTGLAYTSFVETGYELNEDIMRKKQTPFVHCFFRRTEENYLPEDDTFVFDRPSSCYFQAKWDWSSSDIANKWSTKVQAYRFRRLPGFSESDLAFDTGYPIVITKNKVRGTGRAIQFRFENSEIGSDFDLLGWGVLFSGNTRP